MQPWIARLLFWRRPERTLGSFAETEAFGARDLTRAAEQVEDPWVRRRLIRHAQDEVRHAALLDEHAERPQALGLGASLAGETRSAEGIDIESMNGEIPFLAFVHMAERRAVDEFELHREALGERGEVFERILRDEQGHVAWTGRALEAYRAAGRGDEVDAALASFERKRWTDRWLAGVRRLSYVLSAVLLTGLFALLLPFKLFAGRWQTGWVAPAADGSLEHES